MTVLRGLTGSVARILRGRVWLLSLVLIELFFFLVNFGYGRLYAFTDISLIELHPWDEFLKRFSMWQEYRGFGLELGAEAGYAVPLLFFATLSTLGLGTLQINFIYNLLLFVLPGLAVSALAYSIFYRDSKREQISFFAGLLATTSFHRYIRGLHPLFLEVWPLVMVPLITSAVLLLLQTGRKRFWLVLLLLYYLNLGTFTGSPFGLAGFTFAGLYILYYVLLESRHRRQDLTKVLLAGLLFVVVSLPLMVAVAHVVFSEFWTSPFLKSYTRSVLSLNLNDIDFSQLFYGVRLIGTCNWNAVVLLPPHAGELFYPYSTLFTSNPVFVLSSFLLPATAFASLLFKESHLLRRRLLFLGMMSIVFLFLMKGVRDPLGGIFLWLMTNVSAFSIFRTPYDKIAPALVYSLSIGGAYMLSRILPSLRKRSSMVKKAIAVALLIALVINAYPAYSGQLLLPSGFFNLPAYYQELADYVKADPVSYKILGLPEIGYTNRYTWGYFGITLDGVNLNKPVLERSYMGSDLYGERIIGAIQDEALFRSDLPAPFIGEASIFPDNTDPNATINTDRVRYFGYLLQKSNVGKIILRHDMAGDYAYQLSDIDWKRYNDLFSSLASLGLIDEERTFGNVTIYGVNSFMPLIYASSPANVYATNDYDVFLDSRYVNSRMAVLGSLNAYDISNDYVSGSEEVGVKDVYIPLLTDQYLAKIQNDLGMEMNTVIPDKERIAQLNETVQELMKPISLDPFSQYYVDYIRNPGLFDILLRLGEGTREDELPTPIVVQGTVVRRLNDGSWEIELSFGTYKYSSLKRLLADVRLDANFRNEIAVTLNVIASKRLVFGDKEIVVGDMRPVGNGWFRVGSVRLDTGRLLIRTTFPRQVLLTLPEGTREDELPTPIVVQGTVVRRLNDGSWEIELSFGTYKYSSLKRLLADVRLDANFRNEIAVTLNVIASERNIDVALVSADVKQDSSRVPTLIFRRVQSGKFLIKVEHAAEPFFLNFLESYQRGWKLYVASTETLGEFARARDYAGSVELEHGSTPFPDIYDFNALQGASVLDEKHFLLNGFGNSWYIDLNDLAGEHMITQDANGTYSFTLLLYFEPQAYFALGTVASVIVGSFACILICYPTVRTWVLSKRASAKLRAKAKRKSIWLRY